MSKLFTLLFLFFSTFTYNLCTNFIEVPNENIFKNPKKKVTTIESKKNRDYAELDVKINKFNIKKIIGIDIGKGRTQYLIPKVEEIESNKNIANKYLIFKTKEELYNFFNKNGKLNSKINSSIIFEVVQNKNYDIITIHSNKKIYIVNFEQNKPKIFEGNIKSKYNKLVRNTLAPVTVVFNDSNFNNKLYVQNIIGKNSHQINKIWVEKAYSANLDRYINSLPFNLKGWGFAYRGKNSDINSDVSLKGVDFYGMPVNQIRKIPYDSSAFGPILGYYREISSEIQDIYKKPIEYQHFSVYVELDGAQNLGRVSEYSFDTYEISTSGIGTEQIRRTLPVTVIYQKILSPKTFIINSVSENKKIYFDQNNELLFSRYTPRGVIKITSLDNQQTSEDRYQGTTSNGNSYEIGFETQTNGYARPYIIFTKYVGKTNLRFKIESIFKRDAFDRNGTPVNIQEIELQFEPSNIEEQTFNLNLEKAIPEVQYSINLNTGIGKTSYFENNHMLDAEIHQISLGNKLDLTEIEKIELWVNDKNYSSSYVNDSINVSLNGLTSIGFIRKNSAEFFQEKIQLKLFDQYNNLRRVYNINIINPKPYGENYSYSTELDPRFFKALEINNFSKLNYAGLVENEDYSRFFSYKNSSFIKEILSVATIENNYNISIFNNTFKFNDFEFIKNKSPIQGGFINNLKNLTTSLKRVSLYYLGIDNLYHRMNLTLNINSKISKDKIYRGTGQVNLTNSKINMEYQLTKEPTNNLDFNSNGDFITTGTIFDSTSNIVNKIVVNDIEINNNILYSDDDIELKTNDNLKSLIIKKKNNLKFIKQIKIDYYYNSVILGSYILSVIQNEPIILEGIDQIKLGKLLPNSSTTKSEKFILKNYFNKKMKLNIPKKGVIRHIGADPLMINQNEKIELLFSSSQVSTQNNINVFLGIIVNTQQNQRIGEYNGSIDLEITIE